MLNRTPPKSSSTISSYRKKRQLQGPVMMYGAIALVVLGFLLLVYWLTRPEQPLGQFFATDTPTVTVTFTPTITFTPSITPTITETPSPTITLTPSGPQSYTVVEGDTLVSIAERFNLGPDGPLLIFYENPTVQANNGGIFVGDVITIPAPGSVLPTTTPIPANLPRGTLIEYTILPGDTLAGIAAKFNSLPENIIEENSIENANALIAGEPLQIPVNLVTATATLPSTSTPITPTAASGQATAASTAAATSAAATSVSGGTGACTFEENAQYVTQLQQLINAERTNAGLSELTVNPQLTTAAKDHAVDMLCNNYLSHNGLDGSTPEDRVEAAGFTASLVVENHFALHPAYGGNPQAALDWWMNDPDSRANLLHSNTTVVGIAYVSSDTSLLGGYFVFVAARP